MGIFTKKLDFSLLRVVARSPPTGNGQPETGKLKDWKQSLCDTSEGGSKYATFWEYATFWNIVPFWNMQHFGNMFHFLEMCYIWDICHIWGNMLYFMLINATIVICVTPEGGSKHATFSGHYFSYRSESATFSGHSKVLNSSSMDQWQ